MTGSPAPVAPPDLYCITDPDLIPVSVTDQVRAMLAGGARLVQLRHKSAPQDEFTRLAEECQDLCHRSGATFIVNDRVDVALAMDADGVHLGQDDLSPMEARDLLGDEKVIGLSTHSLAQFRAALEEPVDYIAFGPVFPTATKANADPSVGLEAVGAVARELEGDHRPLVLIGGIRLEHLPAIRLVAPKAFVASIGDVLRHHDIAARVQQWRQALTLPGS